MSSEVRVNVATVCGRTRFRHVLEKHPAINLDALLLGQVFQVADRRRFGTQIAEDLIAGLIAL